VASLLIAIHGNSIDRLPTEVLNKIFEHADVPTLGAALQAGPQLNTSAKVVIAERIEAVSAIAKGVKYWEKFIDADAGIEPPLPPDIEKILAEPCPFSTDGKTVAETHILFLMPKNLNGRPLDLMTLGKIIASRSQSKIDIDYVVDNNPLFKVPKQVKSRWTLMTRDAILGSKNTSFKDQITLLAEKGQGKYGVPGVLEATTMHLLGMTDPEPLSSENPQQPPTYTRCKECWDGFRFVVGGFSSGRQLAYDCSINDPQNRNTLVGLAGVRKL
jgi:hypothetical protein